MEGAYHRAPRPSIRMAKLLLIGVLSFIFASAFGGDIYRWVDGRGNTHYGDVVPDQFRSQARRVEVAAQPTPEQRRDGLERASRDREAANRFAAKRDGDATAPLLV